MTLSLARKKSAGSVTTIRKAHLTKSGKIKKGHNAAFKKAVIAYIMGNQM
jgi:hypothetical protein